ncbi:MAG: ribose 5-phosphate isomerase B [Syntrophomonadaceae bacterium]|jgi:RpiB/LacA/LacB family sugar-phosphate isomerase
MKVAIGCDHAGFELKQKMTDMLQKEGYAVIDCGTFSLDSVDYPDIAETVAARVLQDKIPGILICGTGIGISIAANKIPGIRAAVCNCSFTARLAREHNDANILAIGARVIGPGLAEEIIKKFLTTQFLEGRHRVRVEKIKRLENNL